MGGGTQITVEDGERQTMANSKFEISGVVESKAMVQSQTQRSVRRHFRASRVHLLGKKDETLNCIIKFCDGDAVRSLTP